jgi:prepilin-type N-terminal cleavage/methylation domain-containing protein
MNVKNKSSSGFTITELLVVLVIIGMLAALLLPALAQAKAMALNSGCKSNLSRIGVATQSFVNDHEGRLPGPVWMGQPFEIEDINDNTLPNILQRYLKETPANGRLKTYLCPAYDRFAPKPPPHRERVSLIVNEDVDPKGKRVRPFGYPERWSVPAKPPLKLSDVSQYDRLDNTYAVTDADTLNSPNQDNPWFGQLPGKPVHGHHRNELYFDWHVSRKTSP